MDIIYGVVFMVMLSLSASELISLASKNHLLCMTDDVDSAFFMYPPVVQEGKNTSVLIENNELWDDWMLVNSKDVVLPNVLDKRWEDFEIKYTNYFKLDNVVSVSTSTTARSSSSVSSDPPRNKRDIVWQWSHSGVNLVDSSPFTYEGKSDEVAYWKIHDYNLRWSNKTSEKETKIVVKPEDVSCLILYGYVDANSSMSIRAPLQQHLFSSDSFGHPWQAIKIEVKVPTTIKIERRSENGGSDGFWALDIRRCPEVKQNRVFLEKMLSDNSSNIERSCAILSNPDRLSYVKQSPLLGKIFDCEPGLLGVKCDIKCEDFLENKLKYCDQYKICDGSKCLCSWGYEGQFCNQTCSDGFWGLSCQKRCSGCDTCNAKTGDCQNSAALKNTSGLVFLLVLVVLDTFL